MTDWKQALRAQIEQLGNLTTGGIYHLFRQAGVTGRPHNGCDCPATNWLAEQVPLPPGIHLHLTFAEARAIKVAQDGMCDGGEWMLTVPLPDSLRQFIAAFDGGRKYPDLHNERTAP